MLSEVVRAPGIVKFTRGCAATIPDQEDHFSGDDGNCRRRDGHFIAPGSIATTGAVVSFKLDFNMRTPPEIRPNDPETSI